MLISIIVPVYNVEDYIFDCLSSIVNQTYLESIECILVDDCGSDKTMALVNDFINSYFGPIAFHVIHHPYNKGVSAARNSGLLAASGDYVFFLDSDDTITSDCIFSMVQLLEKYPQTDMVIGGVICPAFPLKKWNSLSVKVSDYSVESKWIQRNLYNYKEFPVTPWNRLISRSFILDNNLFFKEQIIHEDELWTYMLSYRLRRMAVLTKPTYNYNIHPDSIMSSSQKNKRLYSKLIIVNEMINFIDDKNSKQQVETVRNKINEWFYLDADKEFQMGMILLKKKLIAKASPFIRLKFRLWCWLANASIKGYRIPYYVSVQISRNDLTHSLCKQKSLSLYHLLFG